MSDLHLASKPGRIRQALRAAEGQILLLPGDLTNDGLPQQFQEFRNCIEESIPDKLLLAVTGNHDMPYFPLPLIIEPCSSYYSFQDWLTRRGERLGYTVKLEAHGAYSVRIGAMVIIGLQCVSHWRRFVFPQGEQIEWLERHLDQGENEETGLAYYSMPCAASSAQSAQK